jgi:hypothetical protein
MYICIKISIRSDDKRVQVFSFQWSKMFEEIVTLPTGCVHVLRFQIDTRRSLLHFKYVRSLKTSLISAPQSYISQWIAGTVGFFVFGEYYIDWCHRFCMNANCSRSFTMNFCICSCLHTNESAEGGKECKHANITQHHALAWKSEILTWNLETSINEVHKGDRIWLLFASWVIVPAFTTSYSISNTEYFILK